MNVEEFIRNSPQEQKRSFIHAYLKIMKQHFSYLRVLLFFTPFLHDVGFFKPKTPYFL